MTRYRRKTKSDMVLTNQCSHMRLEDLAKSPFRSATDNPNAIDSLLASSLYSGLNPILWDLTRVAKIYMTRVSRLHDRIDTPLVSLIPERSSCSSRFACSNDGSSPTKSPFPLPFSCAFRSAASTTTWLHHSTSCRFIYLHDHDTLSIKYVSRSYRFIHFQIEIKVHHFRRY